MVCPVFLFCDEMKASIGLLLNFGTVFKMSFMKLSKPYSVLVVTLVLNLLLLPIFTAIVVYGFQKTYLFKLVCLIYLWLSLSSFIGMFIKHIFEKRKTKQKS